MSPPRLIDPSSETGLLHRARVRLPDRALRQLSGFSIPSVSGSLTREFEYRLPWAITTSSPLHDIKLQDGEMPAGRSNALPGPAPFIDRLTFVPSGCQVTGWSKPKKRNNSYTRSVFRCSSTGRGVP